MNRGGQIRVIKAGRAYQEVAVNSLCEQGDQMVGAPPFIGNRICIGTHKVLWCIGSNDQ
jgi:hypothetical protein